MAKRAPDLWALLIVAAMLIACGSGGLGGLAVCLGWAWQVWQTVR